MKHVYCPFNDVFMLMMIRPGMRGDEERQGENERITLFFGEKEVVE